MAADADLNAAVMALLEDDGPLVREAEAACVSFTREKMYRLYHIPMRYFLDPALEAAQYTLWQEIGRCGCIDLDAAGKPCVLTGKPPVLGPEYEYGRPFDPEYHI